MTEIFEFKAKVWIYSSDKTAWFFVTVPREITEDINNLFGHAKRRWGSLPVKVTVGVSTWTTSIFPNSKDKTCIVPLKADIRKKENIQIDDVIQITLEISD